MSSQTHNHAAQTKQQSMFMFVQISHPSESAAWKKKVRSHAARNPHARRERVSSYQSAQEDDGLPSPRSDSRPQQTVKSSPRSISSAGRLEVARRGKRGESKTRPSPLTVLSAAELDPFNSSVRPLSVFEQNLVHLFKEEVVLKRITQIPGMVLHISPSKAKTFWTAISHHWMHAAVTDEGMLASIFLFTCRHIYVKMGATYPDILKQHAEIYKVALIENLWKTMEKEMRDGVINDDTITKTLTLVSDANLLNNYEDAMTHTIAAADLIKLRDGTRDSQKPERDPSLGDIRILFSENDKVDNVLGAVSFEGSSEASPTPEVKQGSLKQKQKQLVFRLGRVG
ncbi:uncharacterized protein CTRU02_210237 [Colletotrichum truncatum]|uniref:Uncharacterized protein n=1 Tax=Colletotrichum truncatum TaxID=5467 RepID=A0ACC3YW07_COLTU|nr:uncharacterized protein CTRU02_11447 [Colletotrichum truncatum]KAF6785822.1 hypothetical protein CTRU02_11447 [Colletotrichum truncatum]